VHDRELREKKKSKEVSSRSRHREKVRICGVLTARVELGEERRERSRLMLVKGGGKGGEESKKTVSWGVRVMQDVLVLKLSLHVIPPLFFLSRQMAASMLMQPHHMPCPPKPNGSVLVTSSSPLLSPSKSQERA